MAPENSAALRIGPSVRAFPRQLGLIGQTKGMAAKFLPPGAILLICVVLTDVSNAAESSPHTILVDTAISADRAFSNALSAAMEYRAHHREAPIRIVIAPGTYRITRPITVGAALSSAGSLEISGSGDRDTIITGAFQISEKRTAQPAPHLMARSSTYCSKHSITFTIDADVGRLIANDLARSPESPPRSAGAMYFRAEQPLRLSSGFYGDDERLRSQPAPLTNRYSGEYLFFDGYWRSNYQNDIFAVPADSVPKFLASHQSKQPIGGSNLPNWTVLNAFENLKSEDDYAVDLVTNRVTVCGDRQVEDIEEAVSPSIFQIDGGRHVTVRNLKMKRVLNDAIIVRGSPNLSILDIEIHDAGSRGIAIYNSDNVAIRRVEISRTGETGISLFSGNRRDLRSGNSIISNAKISAFGQISKSYRPGILISGVGIQVVNSTISNGPHAAIMFSGNNHLISNNEIYRVNSQGDDAGAIYVGRDWTQRGTHIVGNYIHDNGLRDAPAQQRSVGVYLDDFTSGTTISGNIFINTPLAVLVGGGRENRILNNLFVNTLGPAISIDARGKSFAARAVVDPNSFLRMNLNQVPYAGPIYSKAYPSLKSILSNDPGSPLGNIVSGNAFISSTPYNISPEARRDGTVDAPTLVLDSIDPCQMSYLANAIKVQMKELAEAPEDRPGATGLATPRASLSEVISINTLRSRQCR